MRPNTQAKFRRHVKTWLAARDMTVSALAKRIGRERSYVSVAINSRNHPRVRALIEKEISA